MMRFRYHLPILAYHRVGELRSDHVPTVSAETFERQLTFLKHRRYRVLNLDQIAELLDRGQPLPARSAAITFDDGYEETFTVAWPLLKRFGFPAAVFLTPAEVGLPGFANWDQCVTMAQNGMLLGCHTMSHSYLPLVPPADLGTEVLESKRVLEGRLGRPVEYFSYPVGGFSAQIQQVVRDAGYRAACTTNRAWSHALDRFALRRVKITERDANPVLFWAKLSGYYDTFRRLEQPA